MKEWTDLDYAQAAIDMLPGSVEEIAVFLRDHKVRGERRSAFSCPLAKWIIRWTDTNTLSVASSVYVGGDAQSLVSTEAMIGFMDAYDRGVISL